VRVCNRGALISLVKIWNNQQGQGAKRTSRVNLSLQLSNCLFLDKLPPSSHVCRELKCPGACMIERRSFPDASWAFSC